MEMEVSRPDSILRLESRERGRSLPTYGFSSPTSRVGASCHGMPLEGWVSRRYPSGLGFREKFDSNSLWLWDDTPLLLSPDSSVSIFL